MKREAGRDFYPAASTTIVDLPPGLYTVEFLPAPGWYCPPIDVEVKAGEETRVIGHYLPFLVAAAADYDGDGCSDIATFGPTDGRWRVMDLFERRYGRGGDLPAPGDYDGDGIADLAYFRPSGGHWFVRGGVKVEGLGREGDLPVPADYDGDGRTDAALYRPSTGEWIIALPLSKLKVNDTAAVTADALPLSLWERVGVRAPTESDMTYNPHPAFSHPLPPRRTSPEGEVQLVSLAPRERVGVRASVQTDFGGGPHPTFGRPLPPRRTSPEGEVQLVSLAPRERVGVRASAQTDFGGGPHPAFGYPLPPRRTSPKGEGRSADKVTVLLWGGDRYDLPVPGDYDGDGRDEPAVYNLVTRTWSILGRDKPIKYGRAGELPVPADYDGDGRTDLAMVDLGKGLWRINGLPAEEIAVVPGGVPVWGDFDGDGLLEFGVYDPAGGRWFLEEETRFGEKGDVPLLRSR